uniref:Retrotransposon protein, putative, unclassified n=2 Tax=Oryza sativa subsp. japonica TaxID=39947 RepID=Q6ATT1_ORYSJ|nr:Reverse transcriptase (RNA-dependent DNA polymerase) domain containing protein [Oryza sativa Japonica Group]ABF97409.1 retrotransposon protein, putative, unclassified [Oryza sativa Japonica Group]
MAEQAKAHNLSPSVSGDDGEPNPRRRARTPPPPPRQSPRREEALERVEGSATSTSTGDGGGRRDGERRLLVYGDGSTPQGALQAAGALLRHPPVVPDPESPAQCWLDDVANLVMTARQRLGAGGQSSATKTSGAATTGSVSSRRRARRAAVVARHSAATPSSAPPTQEDLRGGPDARISIERRRNGRRAAHATEGASSSGVSHQHGRGDQPSVPPVGGVGCRAFVASLRNVRWPPRFRPTIAEKYDGSVNPAEFLQVYTTGIEAAGGDDRVMANFFPMALKGQARGWLMNLPPASVHSWEDLCQQFTMNFQGTYPRPVVLSSPQHHTMHPCTRGDLRVQGGVRHNRMLEKIASKEPQTTAELFQLADRVARKEEAWTWNPSGSGVAASAAPGSAARTGRRDRRRKKRSAHSDDEGHVLAVEGASRATRKGRPASDKKKEAGAPSGERPTGKWCIVHNTSLHDLADCRAVKSLAERTRKWEEERREERREGKSPAVPSGNRRSEAKQKAPAEDIDDGDDDLGFQEPGATIATVDGGVCAHVSRRSLKAMKRELLAAAPTHEATRRARWSEVALTFDQTDHPPCVARGGQITMVVSPTVCNVKLGRVLIDGGAALNILFPAAFNTIKAPGMVLRPSQPIIGVTPGHTWPLGHIDLPVTFGGSANFRTERVNFDVADLSLPYNAVLGRPALVKFMAAVHYAYLQMKMPGPGGPIFVHGDLKVALACMEQRADHLTAASKPEGGDERLGTSASAAPRQRIVTCDEVPEDALVSFLRANADVFAWRPADMPGVPREVIEHRLAVRSGARPVRQKVRRQAPERQAFIREEVARLLEAGFIREVIHPEWLANPVVVPKANGKLRMCIDYTDLNKACPKDPYPLPRIDQIVDSTAGCDLLCFLDAYSGYHQIRMAREDEEKTAFITPIGTYCYTTMPFGLKNAGPTFQRTTRISLGSQIGRNVEAHVDDLVVKTRNQETLLSDLAETFESLRSARIKLNPDKCVFGVPAGKLLGILVFARGIKANPEKIRAIERMRPPSKLRDVQCVTGCMAALSRFISRLGEKALPLFKLLKRSGPFTWTEEAERALTQLKAYLSSPHSASRTLVGKAFRQGFYWPTALNDAVDLVWRCRACQFHAKQIHQPAQALQIIPLSWPFAVWGLDILGPFRRAPGGFEYLYVTIDKFTKWPEAYPVVKIDKHSALKFIKGITARFGVPNRIITDNGTQFTSELFGDYCEDMGIKLCFASPAHPRSNGQVERANAEILRGLKTKTFNILKKHGDSWIEELPAVLWANRTTPSRATGETPFFLVYGAEAVLPSELTLRSPRATMYCEADQDQLRRDDLDYLEERRRRAALRAARYQQSLWRYHQRHVRARSLCVDDLVLRRVQTRAGLSKLSPMWEGPYRVIGVPRPGSVRLATGDGTELPNPWNIEHLRRFYP